MVPENQQNPASHSLVIEHVSKTFGNRRVLDDLSFQFGQGVFAITGPNGCGKTTLLSVMAGIEAPDSGRVIVNNRNMEKNSTSAKALIGYLPDEPCIYPFLKGTEFLNLVGTIRGVKDMGSYCDILAAFHLHPYMDTRFSAMSLGIQRKFMLTSVFMQPLPVLLLDEPSNALDVDSRNYLVQLINTRHTTSCVILADHDQSLLNEVATENLELESTHLKFQS